MKLPKTAYILSWFPEPTETFVFREVIDLQKKGLPLNVFTLYGKLTKSLSQEMRYYSRSVERLGIRYLKTAHADLIHWFKKDPKKVIGLLKALLLTRWYGFEKMGENLWALLCAFRLARRFEEKGIEHIHAPWASGPATAAWIASRLSGIPFSFNSHAWDIFPPDGVLEKKVHDACLVRSVSNYNIRYLAGLVGEDTDKIRLTHIGVPFETDKKAPVHMIPPFKLLAIGRLIEKKGYDYLLMACKMLKDSGLDFRLTLAGTGPKGLQLKRLTQRLGLTRQIIFSGFVPHDRVSELFLSADIFIMPSIVHSSGDRDGIPTVIMESLLHRVPVIATDVSGISELIENNVTGLLVPEKQPYAIARAVLSFVKKRHTAIEMAEQGCSRVLKQFNPEINHRKILELYQEQVNP